MVAGALGPAICKGPSVFVPVTLTLGSTGAFRDSGAGAGTGAGLSNF